MSVSEGLICETLYGHAFKTFDVRPNNRDGRFSGVQHRGLVASFPGSPPTRMTFDRTRIERGCPPLRGVRKRGSTVVKAGTL